MASDEEYLSGLLDSLMEDDPDRNNTAPDGTASFETETDFSGKTENGEDDEAWKAGLDELLLSAENLNRETTAKETAESADVTNLTDNMPGSDEDLNEINELLKKTDSNEAAEDDMSSLLESIRKSDTEEKDPKKEKKRKKIKLPWKKKSAENPEEDTLPEDLQEADTQKENTADQPQEEQRPKEMSLRDIEREEETGKKKKKKEKKEKKQKETKEDGGKQESFWNRFARILFGDDEDEEQSKPEEKPEGESSELLRQLEGTDKTGKGEKAKSKKEKKSKKTEKEKKPKEKKKKEKKEKKPDAKEEKTKEPPSRPIGKKTLSLAAIFGLSIFAAVLLLSIILNDFALKQDVKNAYNAGDYKEVYQLLYGKKLNEEETQFLGRASVVLRLERKLDSYEFYKTSGDELHALDSLLRGVRGYMELQGADTYGASDELLRIYQVILEYLNLDYGIGEERAVEISSYENRDYSRAVHSIINGAFSPAATQETGEPEEEAGPQDILPEEEDIINPEAPDEGA